MPKDYIVRIVFDPYHKNILLKNKDNPKELIGGICFRTFDLPKLVEIVFLTIDLKY